MEVKLRLWKLTLLIAYCSFLIVAACDMFMNPMSDFIRDATSEARGMEDRFLTDVVPHTDMEGWTAIPAGKVTQLEIEFRNPQGYELELELTGTGADSGKVAIVPEPDMMSAIITITNPDRLDKFDLIVTGTFAGREFRVDYSVPKMEARHFNTELETLSMSLGTLGAPVPFSNSSSRTAYSAAGIADETIKIDVTAGVPDGFYSSYTINGAGPKVKETTTVDISSTNIITIVVTADCGITHEYIVNISRNAPNVLTVTGIPGTITYGDVSFSLGSTGGTGDGAVSYAVETGTNVIDVTTDGTVTIKNAGTATVRATKAASGPYGETKSQPVTIVVNKRSIALASIASITNRTYDGSEHEPEPAVTDIVAGTDLIKNSDYTLEYANNRNAGTGTAIVSIVPTSSGNYTGERFVTFTINQKSIPYTGLTAQNRSYNGQTSVDLSGTPSGVISGDNIDFTGAVATADAGTGKTVTITVTGDDSGNYAFTSTPAVTVNISKVELIVKADDKSIVYNEIAPIFTRTISGFISGENESVVTGTVTCTTTYTVGSSVGSYTIAPNVSELTATNYFFTPANGTLSVGKANQPALTITGSSSIVYGDTATIATTGGGGTGTTIYTLISGSDVITLNTSTGAISAIKAGTAKVTATKAGDENYNPVTSAEYTIEVEPRDIADTDISAVITGSSSFTYNGSARTPSITISDSGGGSADAIPTITTNDYTLSYEDNTNAGTAKITITGQGNYTGTRELTFTINKADLTLSWLPTASQIAVGDTLSQSILTGGVYTFNGTAVSGDFEWVEGTVKPPVGVHEYNVKFTPDSSNFNAVVSTGPVSVSVTGSASLTITFADITGSEDDPVFTVGTLSRSAAAAGTGGTKTVTVSGFDEHIWYLNETNVSSVNNITINALDYGVGVYNLTLIVEKNGEWYSAVVEFEVVE